MIKNVIFTSLFALGLTACGNSSSSTNESPNTPESNTSESNISSEVAACSVDGNVVLGVEGKSCTYETHTLTCTNGSANLDGGLTAGSGTITINGLNYTCP